MGHLNQQLVEIVKEFSKNLLSQYHPEKIILYGSLASGNIRETSDIDLLIIKDTKENFYDRIQKVLPCLPKAWVGIDYLIYTPQELEFEAQHNPFVREEILKKGKILYDASTGTLAI